MSLPIPSQITSIFSDCADHVIQNLFVVTEGVFESRTTNLNVIKDKLGNILGVADRVQPCSHYKRLIRFFQLPDSEKKRLSDLLLSVSFFFLQSGGRTKAKYLALDGTSWELGDTPIHLLTLSIIVNGVSIPIAWQNLSKKGTSNYAERKALLDRAFKHYNLQGMILLADREYIGENWFKYLKNKGLQFVIRLKKEGYRKYVDAQREPTSPLYKHQKWRYSAMEKLACGKLHRRTGVSKQIEIRGEKYTFVIFKNPKADAKEPLLYFLSTLLERKKIIRAYPIRWKIECCFKHLKSNGFNLEDINLKKPLKVKLMMAVVCFLYTLCISQGLLRYRQSKKSDYKNYSDGSSTLAESVFKKGKSIVSMKFRNLKSFLMFIAQIIDGKKPPKWVHVQ